MTGKVLKPNNIITVPPEILHIIFSSLPAKEVMRCRQVCRRWKSIIDRLACNNDWWRIRCEREFEDYFWTAKRKAKPDMDLFYLYRSMTLWSKLSEAHEEFDEFASTSTFAEEVYSVELQDSATLCVHNKSGIHYYDNDTLKIASREPILGNFARYAENDYLMVIVDSQLDLFIFRKVPSVGQECIAVYDKVRLFHLTPDYLYLVNFSNEIFCCDIHGDYEMTPKFIQRAATVEGVITFSYSKACLNLFTFKRNIYTLINGQFEYKTSVTNDTNIMNVLHRYKFLDVLDWRIYFQWMFVLRRTVPQGQMKDVIVIRSYGDLFFVGTYGGLLKIYYRPFINGEVDLFNSEPVKVINFMERPDTTLESMCPIVQIDIMETENGHIVYVAMPKKVAVIKYTHNLQPPSWSTSLK